MIDRTQQIIQKSKIFVIWEGIMVYRMHAWFGAIGFNLIRWPVGLDITSYTIMNEDNVDQ